LLDEDLAGGRPLPRRVLDSGCGAGLIGICAARALAAAAGEALVRAQDRDKLARIFTRGNGARNGLKAGCFQVRTEALLDAGAGETWDLILSNIPAKAGEPVLRDFIHRSALLLAPGGRVLIVAVKPLADFFRAAVRESGAPLLQEEAGPEHQIFVYGASPGGRDGGEGASSSGQNGAPRRPAYLRNSASYEMEGIAYRITAVHGAAEFDRPGGAAETAAKLLRRLGADRLFPPGPAAPEPGETPGPAAGRAPARVLIHEGGQGHFPLWFLEFLTQEGIRPPRVLVLHGRNILALEAARDSIADAGRGFTEAGHGPDGGTELRPLPGVDLGLDRNLLAARLRGGDPPDDGNPAQQCCDFIAAFPGVVPGTRPYDRIWEGLGSLLLPGGAALIALPAAEADRLIKRRPSGFTWLGDLKRRGFRALACRRSGD
jgi:hypothetical protein